MTRDPFVVVDWGSSRLRLWLADDDPEIEVSEYACDRGIGTVGPGDHEAVFCETLAELFRGAKISIPCLDVYFSGMITSTLGWVPTPYLELPVRLGDLRRGERVERRPSPSPPELVLHFFPGVRSRDDGMRGEEIEVFGCLPDGDDRGSSVSVVVLPGTHSKWIRCEGARIVDFVTVPSGDVHAALHRESLLARTLPEAPAPIRGNLWNCFDRGVRSARDKGPLSSLFQVRALAVLEDSALTKEECSAFLSGVLIGGEICERLPGVGEDEPVIVGGAAALQELYLRALGTLTSGKRKFDAVPTTGEPTVIRAIRQLRMERG